MVNALFRVSYEMRDITKRAFKELCISTEERKESGGRRQEGFYLA